MVLTVLGRAVCINNCWFLSQIGTGKGDFAPGCGRPKPQALPCCQPAASQRIIWGMSFLNLFNSSSGALLEVIKILAWWKGAKTRKPL